MEDQRKSKRYHLVHYLQIFERETDTLLGNMVDITPFGIKLLSDKTIPENTSLLLRMEFPEKVLGTKLLDFDAEAVWCKPDQDNPDLFAIGIEHHNITKLDVQIIEHIIMMYKEEADA